MHVDNTNVDVTLAGDATTGAAVNLVTSPNTTTNLTNGPFVTNHSNMQIGTSTIPIANKSNPKVKLIIKTTTNTNHQNNGNKDETFLLNNAFDFVFVRDRERNR